MVLRKVFLLFLFASIAGSGAAFAAEPASRLVAMAEKLAGLEKFSFNMLITYDVVQPSGQVIEFGETREVLISRPNHLRIDALQSDGDKGGLIFDGETITQFNRGENVYTQIGQPGDADGAIRYAVSQLGVRVPLARMLVTSFPQQMRKLAESAELVELNSLGEVSTEHFAGRSNDLDYQIWLREDNLPARIVLTYKNSPGQPQFRAVFSSWNVNPAVKRSSFVYTPPAGAEKIPTILPAASLANSTANGGGEK